MGIVHRLPDTLISQIAAGEVIERPASVIKELLENSIDAQARKVEIEVEEGGLGRISITDDGVGMTPEDAELALERHATSKLSTQEDLFALATLGFRGEALPSIASVSKFELQTRTSEASVGTCVRVEGGERFETKEVGVPVGTRIVISDLFFNQPARKKFQKTAATEQSQCVNAALRVGLAAPNVRVVVRGKGRTLLDLPAATADERERIAAGLGQGLAPKLYPFSMGQEGLRVHGYAGDPELQASDARNVFLFVNGRYVRDRLLQRAVLEGYRSLLPHGRFPTIVLRVDVTPNEVDVNVHPQKFEVRFREGQRVFGLVLRAIADTLAKTPWLNRGGGRVYQLRSSGEALNASEPAENQTLPPTSTAPGSYSGFARAVPSYVAPSAHHPLQPRMPLETAFSQPVPAVEPSLAPGGFFSRLRILSQYGNLYILCEGEGELVVVDQHAAHERVTFERLLNAYDAGNVPQQRLLFPLTLQVRPDVCALVDENADMLSKIGLEMRSFGEGTIAVSAIPAIVRESRARAYADEAVAELAEAGRVASAEFAHAILARIACHSSVRSGDALTMPEMQVLLRDLDTVDCGVRCPHGRPVVARVSRDAIGRWFERG
jgi:DNA mismatch repair protein MutL